VSTAADVYSFGVVLLEIFIRKRPTDDMFKDGLNIGAYSEEDNLQPSIVCNVSIVRA